MFRLTITDEKTGEIVEDLNGVTCIIGGVKGKTGVTEMAICEDSAIMIAATLIGCEMSVESIKSMNRIGEAYKFVKAMLGSDSAIEMINEFTDKLKGIVDERED